MDFADLGDVVPVPQDDGSAPVCAIAYPPAFVRAHDLLRALLAADERSARALALTDACLKLNPANYTAWHFRRRCLVALSADGSEDGPVPTIAPERIVRDLEFAADLGGTNPKNYQLWYHRRALLEFSFAGEPDAALRAARGELDYVDRILDDDSKNYHAWSHRQWIVRTLNNPQLWSAEVEYSHSKLLADPRNNSAWNQRWFALHEGRTSSGNAPSRGAILSLETATEEAQYALSGAGVDPHNESPWRYLLGVLTEQRRWARRQGAAADAAEQDSLLLECIARTRDLRRSLEEGAPPAPGPCVSLLSALVDLLEALADAASLEEATTLCAELVREDPVRRKYWRRRMCDLARRPVQIA